MVISVSEEDLAGAAPGIIGNPVARALSRHTGVRWRVWDGRVAQEMMAPHRVVDLPDTVQHVWDNHTDLTTAAPFSFEIQLEAA